MRLIAILLLVGAVMANEELPDFDKLWNFQKPEETEAKFRELLPRAEASGNLDYELQLRTQIARTFGLRDEFEKAHEELDAVAERLTEETATARVRYLLERGRAWRSSGNPARGRPLFLEAWDLARRIEAHGLAVDAAHMMALVEPVENRLAWNEKAMAYAEASGDERALRWLGALYNNIGWDYHEQGNYEKALEIHRKGWEWHKARKTGRGERIAQWSVAKQLRLLRRVDEALAMQKELLARYAEAGQPDGYVHEEMAECLLALGQPEEARPHFRQAYELLSQDAWLRKNEADRLERLRKLGE